MFLMPCLRKGYVWVTFYFYLFLPYMNKNHVSTIFRKIFLLLISGAKLQERVNQNSTNHICTRKQGKLRPD